MRLWKQIGTCTCDNGLCASPECRMVLVEYRSWLWHNLAVVGALTEAARRGFKQGQQDVLLQLNPQRFEA
jgi:hypothetical protein